MSTRDTSPANSGAWLALRYDDPAGLLASVHGADILAAHRRLLESVTPAAAHHLGGDGLDESTDVAFPSVAAAVSAAVSVQARLGDPISQVRLQVAAGGGAADPLKAARLQVRAAVSLDRAEASALCERASGGQVLCARDAWQALRAAR